jgi:restriction endonuclease S subunit
MEKLGDVLIRSNESVDPTRHSGPITYVGLENITSNKGKLVGETEADYANIKSMKIKFKSGDILYGKLRPNLNKVWLADREGIASTDILVLRAVSDCDPFYYACYLREPQFNQEVLIGLKGANLPRVSYEYMSQILIPKPHYQEQKMVASELLEQAKIVEANNKLAEIFEQKIKDKIAEVWGG